MREFNSKDFVIHRAISNNIISDLNLSLVKIEKTLAKLFEEYSGYETVIKKSSDLKVIYQNSKNLDKIKESLIYNFAIKRRVSGIINKNKKRIDFFNSKISQDKIPTFEYNQKQILKLISDEKVELKDEKLGLNQVNSQYDLVYFNGYILTLNNGELDLNIKSNYNVLNQLDDKEFNLIINRFPKILNLMPTELLMDIKFKYRIFECIINIVEQMLRTKSAYEVNIMLGSPLLIQKKSVLDIQKFIIELDNLLNVKVVKYLIENFPENRELINEKLKCNFESEFLPLNYRDDENWNFNEIINEYVDEFIDLDLEDILNIEE